MRRILVSLLLAVAAACTSAGPQPAPIAIRNVTVIDGTGAPARPAVTVLIDGATIAGLGPAERMRIPPNARVIDGTGKYLIPGLWDMHTHLSFWGPEALTLLVGYGVLAVRDLGGDLAELDGWRGEIDGGSRIGPRIYRAGSYIDGPKEMKGLRAKTTIVVRDANEARAAVVAQKQRRVDLIKAHNGLSREAYLALADECRKQNMILATHLPKGVRIEEASDAGTSSIEHIEMLTETIAFAVPPGTKPKDALVALDELTDERALETFRRFAKNGTWFDPTLVGYRSFWQEAVDLAPRNPEYRPAALGRGKMFHRFVDLVGMMHRSGVSLLTGSDFGPRPETVPYPVPHPGTDLHDELLLFVQAGLTPLQALKAATADAARFLRVADRLGTIGIGKEANLLLLDADPLANIANTRTIRAVILRGAVLDKEQLERMTAKTK